MNAAEPSENVFGTSDAHVNPLAHVAARPTTQALVHTPEAPVCPTQLHVVVVPAVHVEPTASV